MENETHVDGNALGGMMMEVFGREMTDAQGSCASCGTINAIAREELLRQE